MGCINCLCKCEHDDPFLEVNQYDKNQNTLRYERYSKDNLESETLREKAHSPKNSLNKNEFNKNILITKLIQSINIYRAIHHAEPLILSKNISAISQNHAEKIAIEDNIELSLNKYKGEELGEIIYSCLNEISPKGLVDIWYLKDSTNYNYSNPNPNPSNFTQLIWKNSRYIGIGYSKSKNDIFYLVLNFYPSGNIPGQFIKNVLPPDNDLQIIKPERESLSKKSDLFTVNSDEIIGFYEEALNAHNEYRKLHGVPELILNPILSKIALNHVLKMSKMWRKFIYF